MDGCVFKESRWRKNTCANCFQLKSAHKNVAAAASSPVTGRRQQQSSASPSSNGVPRSESWDGRKGYGTLPSRHSNRLSSGSNISIGSATVQRSNSTLSSSSADVSDSSADRTSLVNGSQRSKRPSSFIESTNSSSSSPPLSSLRAMPNVRGSSVPATPVDEMDSPTRSAVGPKPPTARKPPSTRPPPPFRPSKPAVAGVPNSATQLVANKSSTSDTNCEKAQVSPLEAGPGQLQGDRTTTLTTTHQSSATSTEEKEFSDTRSSAMAGDSSKAHVAVPKPVARSSLRSPLSPMKTTSSSTPAAAATTPPTPSRRSGSARRPIDESTRVSTTRVASSTSTGVGTENTPREPAQAATSGAAGSFRAGNNTISCNSSSSSSSSLSKGGRAQAEKKGIAAGSATTGDGGSASAVEHRAVKTVAMDPGSVSGTSEEESSRVRGDVVAGPVASPAKVAGANSSEHLAVDGQLGVGEVSPAGEDGKKKPPTKPSRSKTSYSASPDLIRAHASKLEMTRKSPSAVPARAGYEDIWTATKSASASQRTQSGMSKSPSVNAAAPVTKEAHSKPGSRTKSPLSPTSSDLDKMVSGTSTDLDAIVSGKKRPGFLGRRTTGKKKEDAAKDPSHDYTEVPLVSETLGEQKNRQAASADKADTESLYSVPGELRRLHSSDSIDGIESEYKIPQPAGDYRVPRASSSTSVHSAGSGGMQRSVSEAHVSGIPDSKPKTPARSASRPSILKPASHPPPPPPSTAPPTAPGVHNGVNNGAVTARQQSNSSDESSPATRRSNTLDGTRRQSISGKPNRAPPPPPPSEILSPQEDSPFGEPRNSVSSSPPRSRKFTNSGTAPGGLEMLMKSVNEAGGSFSRLSPKIGTKVWKNLRKTHERTLSLIRQRRPGRKSSQNRLDTSDDERSPSTSREPSRAPSAVEPTGNSDAESLDTHSYAGESGCPTPEAQTPKATPPRKPSRSANSFKRIRKNNIDPNVEVSPSSVSTESSSSQPTDMDRAASNDTLTDDFPASTVSLRSLVDAALSEGSEAQTNTLPLPPKPVRPTIKPAEDAPALPPRKPGQSRLPPQSTGVRKPSDASPRLPVPVSPSQMSQASSPSPVSPTLRDSHDALSTPVPPPEDSEVERELSLLRSDYHALNRSSFRGLSNVVKRLSRCVCNERQKPIGGVPKNWSQIEVLGCEDDGPHGTCSIHAIFKGRDGKIPMTAQLEPILTGNEEDGKLYAHDCKIRALLPPHANVIRTQAKFSQTVPKMVCEMLELAIPTDRECTCYFTESTADYVDAEIYFSSLNDPESGSQDALNQTAFVFTQVCLALQHLAANGVVHRNIQASSVMIGPVSQSMSPIQSGDCVLLTSFGHALSLPTTSPNRRRTDEDLSSRLVFKRSVAGVVDVRRTDTLPPEIRLNSRSEELDYSGCDAYALGMLMRSVVDCTTSPILKRLCEDLCKTKLSERLTVSAALCVFQCIQWGPSEAEVPGWTNPGVALDKDRLCAWLDIQRSERLGVMALKLARFKISFEDYLQCSFLVNVTMDDLLLAQEHFASCA